MDAIKIQIEMLRLVKAKLNVRWYVTDNDVYLMPQPSFFVIIPPDKYFLNLEKYSEPVDTFLKVIKQFEKDEKYDGEFTDVYKKLDGKNLIKVHSKDFDLWFDEKLLKFYGDLKHLKIVVTGAIKPAAIYNLKDEFLGIIMPMRISI